MSWLRYLRRKQREDDFGLEIEAYLQHEIDENVARGMNPREAAQAARRKFGNVTIAKEALGADRANVPKLIDNECGKLLIAHGL